MQQVVITQVASTARGMPAEELGELAAAIFGADRVTVAPRLDDALETAVSLAEADGVGAPGVLVTGSVVLVGEARTLLVSASRTPSRPTSGRRRRPTTMGSRRPDGSRGDLSAGNPCGWSC